MPAEREQSQLEYICQATTLQHAGLAIEGMGLQTYLGDLLSRSRSSVELARIVGYAVLDAICLFFRGMGYPKAPRGKAYPTPNDNLSLKVGERVRVKSVGEIVATLDSHGKNRGLIFDRCMVRYSNKEFTVEERVERLISPQSGKMVHMKPETPLIRLSEVTCDGVLNKGCLRSEYLLWREAWLTRLTPSSS